MTISLSYRKARIYLAAPLFTPRERAFNADLKALLSEKFDVYLPQVDGLLLADLVRQGVNVEVAEKLVFDADVASMKEVDLLLAVLDGASIDEGVAFEIGFVYSLGKRCVGLQTDIRRQLPTGNNPMIGRSLSRIFMNVDELLDWANWFGSHSHARHSSACP